MNRFKWVFLGEHGLRAGWRFALFLAFYLIAGEALNRILPKVHFPDRTFTWSSLLLNYLLDFAFVAAIAWAMSRIERERLWSYGLPLVRNVKSTLAKT